MIHQVSTNFVPIAVNLYKIRAVHNAGGDLFRLAQAQNPQYQGIWILTPEGKLLAAHQDFKSQATWAQEVLTTIETAEKNFGAVTPRQVKARDPLPNRGTGVLADGSVSLALYTRYMRGGGKQGVPPGVNQTSLWMWEGQLQPDGPPVIDSIALSPQEWAALSPPKVAAGAEWTLPDAVARKFSRALSPSSDQSLMPRPEETSLATLTAKVEAISNHLARLRFTGRLAAKHLYDGKASYGWATVNGIALYDTAQQCLNALQWEADGAFRMPPPWDKEDRPICAVIEWKRTATPIAARRLP